MHTKMRKDQLAAILSKNLDNHKEIYKKAWEGYRKAVIDALKTNLDAIESGKKIQVYVHEVMPSDHSEEYLRALEMIGHNVDDTIVLSAEDYSRYVQDNWQWKQNWTTSNSKYLG